MVIPTRTSGKLVTTHLASLKGYSAKGRLRAGTDEESSSTGRLQWQWTRPEKKPTICSVDDLSQPLVVTVEFTSDNAESKNLDSRRYFHSKSLKGDVIEKYCVHSCPASGSNSSTGMNKKVEVEIDHGDDADDSLYTLDFNLIEESKSLEDTVEESDTEQTVDNDVPNAHLAARRSKDIEIENEMLILDSVSGMQIDEFAKWKSKAAALSSRYDERYRRMAEFTPMFEEKAPENETTGKKKGHEQSSLYTDEEYDTLDDHTRRTLEGERTWGEATWETTSTNSTLSATNIYCIDGPMSSAVKEAELAHEILVEFAESKGIPVAHFTDFLDNACRAIHVKRKEGSSWVYFSSS